MGAVLRFLFTTVGWTMVLMAFEFLYKKIKGQDSWFVSAFNAGKEVLSGLGLSPKTFYSFATGNPSKEYDKSQTTEGGVQAVFADALAFFEGARSTYEQSPKKFAQLQQMLSDLPLELPELSLGEDFVPDGAQLIQPPTILEPALSGQVAQGQVIDTMPSVEYVAPQEVTVDRKVRTGDSLDITLGKVVFVILAFLAGLVVLERFLPPAFQFLQPIYDRLGIFQGWYQKLIKEDIYHGVASDMLDRAQDAEVIRGTKVMLLESLLNLRGKMIGGRPAVVVLMRLMDDLTEGDIIAHYKLLERSDFSNEERHLKGLIYG